MAKKPGGIFSKKQAPPPPRPALGNMGLRIRLVEEKINNINRKVEILETTVLDNYKKTMQDFKVLDDEFTGLRHAMNSMQQKMDLVIKELKMSAGKDEVRAIQKYLDLWNPVKFATREEVDRLLGEKAGSPEASHKDKT